MFKKIVINSRIAAIVASLLALNSLSACSTLDEAFGLAKIAPDESQVITHKPLVTPQVATLPQPGEGVDNTIVPEPEDKMEMIKKQLAEERKRRVIHEGATPEQITKVQALNPKVDVREYATVKDARTPSSGNAQPQETKKKSWWKIW